MCSVFEADSRSPDRQRAALSSVPDCGPPLQASAGDRKGRVAPSSVEVQRFVRHSTQPDGAAACQVGSERLEAPQVGL